MIETSRDANENELENPSRRLHIQRSDLTVKTQECHSPQAGGDKLRGSVDAEPRMNAIAVSMDRSRHEEQALYKHIHLRPSKQFFLLYGNILGSFSRGFP
jgi:hypothetical protein